MAEFDYIPPLASDPENASVLPYNLPDIFTHEEWLVLFSLTSAIIPPIDNPHPAFPNPTSAQAAVLASSATIDNAKFREFLVYVLRDLLPPPARKGLKFILGLLAKEGFFPSYMLWSRSGAVPFYKKSLEERMELIQSWLGDSDWVFFPPLKKFARVVTKLTCSCWIRAQSSDESVLFEATGVKRREQNTKAPIRNVERKGTEGMGDGVYPFEFLDLSKERTEDEISKMMTRLRLDLLNDAAESGSMQATQHGVRPKHAVTTQIIDGEEIGIIETDVVVVGSGPGGGVIAKKVAEANGRCIVVEKGNWYPHDELPLSEEEAMRVLYEGKGLFIPGDSEGVSIIAGSMWGGGGGVNWSVCLQTQGFVREEWATKHGLKFFLGQEFQNKLDGVFDRLGATVHHKHNHRNNTLLEGSHKLGYHAHALPQNSGGTQHLDGFCTSGCGGDTNDHPTDKDGWGWKLGVGETYLPDAARAGAEFIQGLHVGKIIIEDGVAVGVEGIWTPPPKGDGTETSKPIKVIIRAKRVVVSAGGLQTPALLLKSKIQNPNIGYNLRIHPTCLVHAVFPEETNPMAGGSTTAVVSQFEDLDGEGYGTKIQCLCMAFGLSIGAIPWEDPVDWKRKILQFNHLDSYICISRDKGSGRVYINSMGQPKVDYVVSNIDRKHILEGVCGAAKIAYIQGAKEIFVSSRGIPTFIREEREGSFEDASPVDEESGILDPKFQAWLENLRAIGLTSPNTTFGCAHQLSSCRMGIDPTTSVVDPSGKVWDVENLYIADGSVLPSATGVNPMVTIMATAELIGDCLLADMGREWDGRAEEWRRQREVTVAVAKQKLKEMGVLVI